MQKKKKQPEEGLISVTWDALSLDTDKLQALRLRHPKIPADFDLADSIESAYNHYCFQSESDARRLSIKEQRNLLRVAADAAAVLADILDTFYRGRNMSVLERLVENGMFTKVASDTNSSRVYNYQQLKRMRTDLHELVDAAQATLYSSKGQRQSKDRARVFRMQILGDIWFSATGEKPNIAVVSESSTKRRIGDMSSDFGLFLVDASEILGEVKCENEALRRYFERNYIPPK